MEMNWKTWAPAVAAVVLGGAAAKIAFDSVNHRNATASSQTKVVRVVTVKDGVQPGQELTAEHLTLTPIGSPEAPANAFTDVKAVVGRVAAAPLAQGQLVVQELLAREGSVSGLTALVPSGKRAIAIEVNETSSLSGMLAPGCRVDVIATLMPRLGQGVSRTIVQNVLVQAVGQRLANVRQSDEKDSKQHQSDTFRSITLITTPSEAEMLQLAATNARMTVVLRGTGDNEEFVTGDGTNFAKLSGHEDDEVQVVSVPGPTTAPAGTTVAQAPVAPVTGPTTMPTVAPAVVDSTQYRTVQLISGGKMSTVRFELRKPDAMQADTSNGPAIPELPGSDQ